MSNISYKRDMDHNYLVIEKTCYEDNYQIGMLTGNKIPGLLDCSFCQMDGRISFYYEITSKQSLELLLERKRLTGQEIVSLLEGILNSIHSCREYLLPSEGLLLSPEFIYLDPDEWSVSLLFDPLRETSDGNTLQPLAEYLLEHLDRQDSDAVTLGYEFYRISGEENPSLSTLLDEWHQNKLFKYGEADSNPENEFNILAETGGSVHCVDGIRPAQCREAGSQNISRENIHRENTSGKHDGGTMCLSDLSCPAMILHSQNAAYPDFKITGDSFVVGKKKDVVDGLLKARGISRLHGKISKEGDYYYITDLNSTNGTYLNGGRLDIREKARLRSGDSLAFADIKYIVEF